MEYVLKAAESRRELEGAYALRHQVFVQEQHVPPELERDDLDSEAFHAVALNGNTVVGTGRLVLHSADDGAIGRMAIHAAFRRQSLGGRVLWFLEREATARGLKRITLHAQLYVKEFYTRHGYREEGKPFMEAGIRHIQMSKKLL